eukprot:3932041-Rhodomonas_salina.1
MVSGGAGVALDAGGLDLQVHAAALDAPPEVRVSDPNRPSTPPISPSSIPRRRTFAVASGSPRHAPNLNHTVLVPHARHRSGPSRSAAHDRDDAEQGGSHSSTGSSGGVAGEEEWRQEVRAAVARGPRSLA